MAIYAFRVCRACRGLCVSAHLLGKACYSVGSTLVGKETCKKYLYISPQIQESTHCIRRAILRVRNGTVEDIIQSIQCDEACSRIEITSDLVDNLISNFGDDWKSALGFFQWVTLHTSHKPTPYVYDMMVDLLGKRKQMDVMWDVVKSMHADGLVTLETIAKVMRRLAGAGKWLESVQVFDGLESMGIQRNTESMNILLDALCKERQVEAAHASFVELKACIPPNLQTYGILVNGWCIIGRIDEAKWTILEMKGCGFQPSVVVYSTIIKGYCNRFDLHKVYEVLDEMQSDGCVPNAVTYTMIMDFLAKSQKFKEAIGLVHKMKASGCKPDTVFYNALINILGRSGRLVEAVNIFELGMQKDGVDRDLSTYNTMISIYCFHCQEQKALDVLQEMKNASCKPDLTTYSPLLKLYFKTGNLDCIDSLLDDIINKHHMTLDLATYTLLIHGHCRTGKIESACVLFDEMISRDMLPRSRTCKILMMSAEKKHMVGTVEKIEHIMKHIESSRR